MGFGVECLGGRWWAVPNVLLFGCLDVDTSCGCCVSLVRRLREGCVHVWSSEVEGEEASEGKSSREQQSCRATMGPVGDKREQRVIRASPVKPTHRQDVS
jgi:hypothetical protein